MNNKQSKPKLILLIDDNKDHVELIRRAFLPESGKYELIVTGTLTETRKLLKKTSPELMLVDYRLPDGKGTELLPDDPEKRTLPVIMLTSHGDEGLAATVMKAGAMDYIVKSDAAFADILHIINRVFGEWAYITERKQAEKRLRAIAQLSTQATGEDFFRLLIESVARTLGVKVVFVAEFISTESASARSLAIWISDGLVENMQWTLSGTPCEQVAKGKNVFFSEGVQAAFPNAQWLSEVGLESYLGIPMMDHKNRVIGHIGVMDDQPFSERKTVEDFLSVFAQRAAAELERMRMHEVLVSSEANFRNLVEADCYALVVHRDFHLLYANAEAKKMFKVPDQGSLPGKSIFDYVHPRYQNFARLSIQRVVRRNESIVSIQIKGVTAGGQELDVDLRSMPIQFDGSAAVMTIIYDITERKQAEAVLLESENRLQSIIEGNPVPTIITRMSDGLVRYANQPVGKLFRVLANEVIGKQTPDYFIHPEERDLLMQELVETGRIQSREVHLRRPDGTLFWALVTLSAIEFENEPSAMASIYDITERKLAEEALQESEEKFRRIIDHLQDTYYQADAEGVIQTVSSAVEDLLGYTSAEIIGSRLSDYYTEPDGRTKFLKALAATDEGKVFGYEVEILHKNGQRRWVSTNAQYLYNEDGKITGVEGTIRDVSERKRIEYFTGRTSEILEMVVASYPADEVYDAICRMYEKMHPRMRTSILSLKGNRLFHCSALSLPEEYSKAINGGEIGPRAGSCGTAAFLGKEVIVEDIATDPLWEDYKDIALLHNLRACWSEPVVGRDGNILGTFAMYFDQPAKPSEAEFKEIRNASGLVAIVMEKELKEASLRKLSSAIEQAGESIVITDRQGIIEYANPAFTKLTGYSAEEAVGQTPKILKSGNQDDTFYEEMWATITCGKVWHGKVIDRKKDGSFYPTMLTISPIFDQPGEGTAFSHFVGIQSDLTKLEDMEHQFHQAQKMETIGTLVGGIAHDFNNMLAGMTGNLYLAKQRILHMPDVVRDLDTVESIAFRAADMIKQLLVFARKDMVSIKQISLNPFLEEILKLLRTSVPENIKFHQEICNEALQIKGDSTQLHQVLLNLLGNARDAVEKKDDPFITIKLESFHADAAFIDSHPYFEGRTYAHISVEDNGCGIPEHQIEHLFEPFFTTKEVGKGTGLGLAMVYGAVKTHHGFVEVESSKGEGSTFHIYIPLLHTDKTEFKLPQKQEFTRGHGELILLIDDELQIIDTGKEVLESLGYQVLTASNGNEAVEIFEQHSDEIDLCILDVVMPVMGGDKAAQQIRLIKPDIKVIFSTGYDQHLLADMADEVVLSKPFSIENMSHLIWQQLGS